MSSSSRSKRRSLIPSLSSSSKPLPSSASNKSSSLASKRAKKKSLKASSKENSKVAVGKHKKENETKKKRPSLTEITNRTTQIRQKTGHRSYKDLKESEAQLVEDITSLEELAREFQAEKKHKAQLVSKLKEKLEAERQAHQASIAAFTAQIEELNAENQDMQQQCQETCEATQLEKEEAMQTQATQHTNIAEALKLEKSQLEKQMHTFQRKLEEVGVNAITLRPCALTAVDANNTIGLKEAYRARLDRLSASLPQRLQHVKERLSDVQGMGMQMDADDIAVISGRADTSADIDVDASNTTDMTESTIGDTRESNNTARTHMEETKEQIEEQPEEIEEQNEEVEEAEADREQHTLEHEKEEAQIEEEKDQDQDQEEEEEEVQGEEEEEEQEQEEEEEEEEHEEEQQEEQVEEEVEINAHVEERMEQESEEEELEPQQQHVDGAIAFHFQPSNDLALSLDEEEKRFMEELAAQAQ